MCRQGNQSSSQPETGVVLNCLLHEAKAEHRRRPRGGDSSSRTPTPRSTWPLWGGGPLSWCHPGSCLFLFFLSALPNRPPPPTSPVPESSPTLHAQPCAHLEAWGSPAGLTSFPKGLPSATPCWEPSFSSLFVICGGWSSMPSTSGVAPSTARTSVVLTAVSGSGWHAVHTVGS